MSQSTEESATVSRRTVVRAGVGAAIATTSLPLASGTAAAAYGGWLDGVDGYEGTVDYTGRDEVTVTVGAGEGLSFDPVAILVDPGTTVVWEWSGKGGTHNVAHEGGAFKSELVSEEGHTFKHTFETEQAFRYACQPHKAIGMKGVVAVGSTDDKLIDPESSNSTSDGSSGSGGSGSSGSGSNGGNSTASSGGDGGGSSASGGVSLSRDDLVGTALGLATAIPLLSVGLGIVDLDPE